jgi:hypothetical protein
MVSGSLLNLLIITEVFIMEALNTAATAGATAISGGVTTSVVAVGAAIIGLAAVGFGIRWILRTFR